MAELKYGENPHQRARSRRDGRYEGPTILNKQLHGKPVGYNNLLDANAALEVMIDLSDRPAAVVIKHGNPCGLAVGKSLPEVFDQAWYGDEVSAFGSVIGFSQEVTEATLKKTAGKFVEAVVAPSFSDDAIGWVQRARGKKNLRLIPTGPLEGTGEFNPTVRIRGGTLSQSPDNKMHLAERVDSLLMTRVDNMIEPNSEIAYTVGCVTHERYQLHQGGLVNFSMVAGKHTQSNAIVIAYQTGSGEYRVLGMGAGQPNRLDAIRRLALPKARENLMREYLRNQGSDSTMDFHEMMEDPSFLQSRMGEIRDYQRDVLGSDKVVLFSDAFFPKPDAITAAAHGGIKYIVAPGGSKGDGDVIQTANQHDIAMVFTGIRHFRH